MLQSSSPVCPDLIMGFRERVEISRSNGNTFFVNLLTPVVNGYFQNQEKLFACCVDDDDLQPRHGVACDVEENVGREVNEIGSANRSDGNSTG
ncbi:unnamed protein product [Hymenolepis diminuta]|uniref:Uncharacterized protein n=1 Tax=Hymenolepis diminuta TaxID=6216 RepID=A0A564XUR1_HYMDI|nr:unnamed protein product [Hymenolepis diminuta]